MEVHIVWIDHRKGIALIKDENGKEMVIHRSVMQPINRGLRLLRGGDRVRVEKVVDEIVCIGEDDGEWDIVQ